LVGERKKYPIKGRWIGKKYDTFVAKFEGKLKTRKLIYVLV
jgi:hypothetical protein